MILGNWGIGRDAKYHALLFSYYKMNPSLLQKKQFRKFRNLTETVTTASHQQPPSESIVTAKKKKIQKIQKVEENRNCGYSEINIIKILKNILYYLCVYVYLLSRIIL